MTTKIRDKVKKWLIEENMFASVLEDTNAHFNYSAHFQKITFNVLQPLSKKDSVIFVCSLILNSEQKKRLTKIEKMELYKILLSRESLFEFRPNIKDLEDVRIQDLIFYDGLTKNEFMKTIFRLLKTVQITNQFIQPNY